MKNLKLDQKGIAHIIPIMLIILVIGVVAFSAYKIGSKDSSKGDDTTVVVKKGDKKPAEEKKKTYQFEETDLKIDIPAGWQIDIEKRNDVSQDGKNDSYNGKIKAKNGWGISFDAGLGGIGGGPGCNYQGEDPSSANCPKYTVNSNDILQTKGFLLSYSSNDADKNNFPNNCTVMKDSASLSDSEKVKVGNTFEGSGWTCFSSFNINESVKDPFGANKPSIMRISVVFPYDLDKKASTEFLKDNDYKAVIEALKTLRDN